MPEQTPIYFKEFTQQLNKRFDHIDERFNVLEHRFDTLEARFDGMEKRMERIEDKIDIHGTEIKDLQKRTSVLESAYA